MRGQMVVEFCRSPAPNESPVRASAPWFVSIIAPLGEVTDHCEWTQWCDNGVYVSSGSLKFSVA
jgi:hypothetical protein